MTGSSASRPPRGVYRRWLIMPLVQRVALVITVGIVIASLARGVLPLTGVAAVIAAALMLALRQPAARAWAPAVVLAAGTAAGVDRAPATLGTLAPPEIAVVVAALAAAALSVIGLFTIPPQFR